MLLIPNRSNLHRRICSVGLLSQGIYLDRTVLASTSLEMLLNAYCSNRTKFQRLIWIVLDGFNLFLSTDRSRQLNNPLPPRDKCQIDIFSVGNLGGLFDHYTNPYGGAKTLLYSQNMMPQAISCLHAMSPRARSCQYHYLPRTLYLSGDLIKNPISIKKYFTSEPNIVFTGQDGRFSAMHALHLLGMDQALEQFQDLLAQIDRSHGHLNELILFSVTAIKQATQYSVEQKPLNAASTYILASSLSRLILFSVTAIKQATQYSVEQKPLNAASTYILASSLSRLIILRHLAPMSWFHLIPYPSSYLNICSWPQIGNYHVLDLGGINGSEYYYPRSVDLAINRIKTIRPEPIDHNKFFNSTDSVYHYSRKLFTMIADMLSR